MAARRALPGVSRATRFAAEIQAEDRGLCEVMGSRPELMYAAAGAAGLPDLCDRLVKRAQRSRQLRGDLEWEDVPMIACALGSATQASPKPSVGAGRGWSR